LPVAETLVSLALAIAVVLSAIGMGLAILKFVRVSVDFQLTERLAWGFAVGSGCLGWFLFFPAYFGVLTKPVIIGIIVIGFAGYGCLGRLDRGRLNTEFSLIGWLWVLGILAFLAFDFVEALAPPSDADTLAYHFTLPKLFIQNESLVFVARGADGATPFLAQMAYIPTLALGGESSLTFWTMLSGWGTAALMFVILRRHLDLTWSLAGVLVFLGIPAVTFGAGSGQVEVRIAAFALAGAYAVGLFAQTGLYRYLIIAGLAGGFFAGSKFFGLFFLLACGLVLLLQQNRFKAATLFSLVAVCAGFQWYLFLWEHTGDPAFPTLFKVLNLPDTEIWTREFDTYFKEQAFAHTHPIASNIWNLFAYPFIATLHSPPIIEARRTGFGPFLWLILPFALAAVYVFRDRLRSSPLMPVAIITAFFYIAWFFGTPSQRVRFLLPILPLLFVPMLVAAERWARASQALPALVATVVLSAGLQFAGTGLFSLNAMKYLVSSESRDDYLERTVPFYGAVEYVNRTLTPKDKVLHINRQFSFLLNVPEFFANTSQQMLVELWPKATSAEKFWGQLRGQKITHLVFDDRSEGKLKAFTDQLAGWSCALKIGEIKNLSQIKSRTLTGAGDKKHQYALYKLTPAPCALNS
jgi:hypothetical protein